MDGWWKKGSLYSFTFLSSSLVQWSSILTVHKKDLVKFEKYTMLVFLPHSDSTGLEKWGQLYMLVVCKGLQEILICQLLNTGSHIFWAYFSDWKYPDRMTWLSVTLPILHICNILEGKNTLLKGVPKDQNFRHGSLHGLFQISVNARYICLKE